VQLWQRKLRATCWQRQTSCWRDIRTSTQNEPLCLYIASSPLASRFWRGIAYSPYRILIISNRVCACGIFILHDTPSNEKNTIIGLHPAANPVIQVRTSLYIVDEITNSMDLIPHWNNQRVLLRALQYSRATTEQKSISRLDPSERGRSQHTEITAEAVKPVRTERLAVMNLMERQSKCVNIEKIYLYISVLELSSLTVALSNLVTNTITELLSINVERQFHWEWTRTCSNE